METVVREGDQMPDPNQPHEIPDDEGEEDAPDPDEGTDREDAERSLSKELSAFGSGRRRQKARLRALLLWSQCRECTPL